MINFKKPYLLAADGSRVQADFYFCTENGCRYFSFIPARTARLKEAVLFSGPHGFAPNSVFYGDGYQKLSQYGGTLARVRSLTYFTDRGHYKMPQTPGFSTVYNYALLQNAGKTYLIGAASGRRFRTEIRINATEMQVVQCLEDLEFPAGTKVRLEEMTLLCGSRQAVLQKFAALLRLAHPPKTFGEIPAGWCSWYCVGPDISEEDIFENLRVIREKAPRLKYIQIDDGFQPYMGDWLETGDKFSRPMREICHDIRVAGFEPAIWLAPFIASPKSRLLREHPDYFVQDENGCPLCSQHVTFGGWRDGPWYFLDGTNPGAQRYLYDVVREMYKNWGVRYFKLDANVWGALPFGVRYDPAATCMEAYRRGMNAIWHAVENDAYILGCNAPMWASLGTVTAMRVTGDIVRRTSYVAKMSKECFHRNWMHGMLWVNDPDCLIMADTSAGVIDPGGWEQKKHAGGKFYRFNNIYVRASGGTVLCGDYIKEYTEKDLRLLERLLNAPHEAAVFDDALEVGTVQGEGFAEYMAFNRKLLPKKHTFPVPPGWYVQDMYRDVPVPVKNGIAAVTLGFNGACWIRVSKA